MLDTPKRIKRLIREYGAIAHDRELSQALDDLRLKFERWKRAEISASELNDLVHQFHQGRSRNIWAKYAANRLEPALGLAIATGVLAREELPAELLLHLAGVIDFYEEEVRSS
jgi:hypothetical protein